MVEDQELFLAAEFQLVQNTPNRFHFAIDVFGACVHDMNQQTRVTELLKSSVKSGDQIGGQISDEAHRVRDDDFALPRETQSARDGVESGKHLVFDEDVGVGESPQEGALTGIGVSDDGENRHLSTLSFSSTPGPLVGESAEVALQAVDALPNSATIALQFRFAWPPPSDSASQTRERKVGSLGEPRHAIAKLSEFHLQFAVTGRGPLSKDIQDQLRAIDHPELHSLGEVPSLGRIQVLIENHEIDVFLETLNDEIGQLSRSNHRLRIDLPTGLGDDADHFDSRRASQFLQLIDMDFQGFPVAPGRDRNEQGSLTFFDFKRARGPGELIFEVSHMETEIQIEFMGRAGREEFCRTAFLVGRGQKGDMGWAGKAVFQDGKTDHGVQAKDSQIRQVVRTESFVSEVGMDTAQASQPTPSGSQSAPVRQLNGFGVTDHDMLNVPAAADHDSDLTTQVQAERSEFAREFRADYPVRGQTSTEQSLKVANLP